MKIVGVLALNRFPLFQNTVKQLSEICTEVYVRFDATNGDPSILKETIAMLGPKLGGILMANGWTVPGWREDMIRLLDKAEVDIVLCPDEDEVFGEGIEDELKAFWYSDKSGMMFDYYPLATKDGREVNKGMPYPPHAHMKAFKWKQGLTYYPYHGSAMISQYCNPDSHWLSRTKIHHYCCWTLAMEKSKHWRSNTPKFKGTKSLTLLGFGPTSRQDFKGVGEMWSLNNCYDVFTPEVMKYVTRIFEMHKFGPRTGKIWDANAGYLEIPQMINRDDMIAVSGKYHVEELDRCGREGRRIIMQEPHARITNSEAYPIHSVIRKTGVDWFQGTPCYMVAMALCEKFTHINCYGLDQMDWEHSIQRECFAGWMMYAIGRGVKVGGVQTWLQRFDAFGHKRYGYDYGPEWCEWCEKTLWQGFPISIKFKDESRIIDGDMYKPGGAK